MRKEPYQRCFIDRTIYYTSFPIQASSRKGDRDYSLPKIYWLYIINNLALLNERPAEPRGKVFERFFHAAEIARFTPEERSAYEASLKNMRDYNNTINPAEYGGSIEGIAKATGLAEMEINAI